MYVFVFGASASGKSAYAGRLAEKLAVGRRILYIATMPPQGRGAAEKIRRHQALREGGNYEVRLCLTLDDLNGLAAALEGGIGSPESPAPAILLLDSMDGFLADVLFAGSGTSSDEAPEVLEAAWSARLAHVRQAVERLRAAAEHLVVVTDSFFADGNRYDALTERYIEAAGKIGQQIAGEADAVIEVVCGIPVAAGPLKLLGDPGQAAPRPAASSPAGGRGIDTPFHTIGEVYEFLEIPYPLAFAVHADPDALR